MIRAVGFGPSLIPKTAREPFPGLAQKQLVYAIGDIHGRLHLLTEVTAAIDDFVDREPHSAQVDAFVIKRQTRRHMVCLAGNHEELNFAALPDHAQPAL